MKKYLILSIILLISVFVHAQNAKKLNGKWKGSYFCRQGETGVTLKIKGKSNGTFCGTFKFYPLPSNLNAKAGKFSFTGTFNTSGKIIITQKKWLKQPNNYIMVDLEGELINQNTIRGKIVTDGCDSFNVIRK